MAASTIEYTYQYPFASAVVRSRWNLAGTAVDDRHATFFQGGLQRPDLVSQSLLVLNRIVRTHFFDARPSQRDPIVTSSPKMVRWEGFSGCCGAYARVDLDQRAFQTAEQTFGTTNVDFNTEMVSQLSKVGRHDETRLSISNEAIVLRTGEAEVVERKVPLPRRWIKGLSEVQAYQTKLKLRHTLHPASVSRLLQSLGTVSRGIEYLAVHGSAVRLSRRQTPGSLAIGGAERLKPLAPLLLQAREVGLWSDENSGVFAVSIELEIGRFWFVLSPAMHRGFSGEGQLLQTLTSDQAVQIADEIYDLLGWQSELHPAELAVQLGCRAEDAAASLAILSTRGIAGFDAASGYYFHRELPFAIALAERDQPRLKSARMLIDKGHVRILGATNDGHDIEVTGNTATQFVRLRSDGDRCTCVWYTRHQGQRGPCKHILAARILVDSQR
ncbi:hypothetical protein [Novipirellula caenicola]|uniref:SWIM-type domain-containing protein n=1 Tax=Novipirellula caenicola TaxID=1536901 RepID=A0ABP9VWS8_9BACT